MGAGRHQRRAILQARERGLRVVAVDRSAEAPGLPALDSVLRVLLSSLVVLAFGYWYFQRKSGEFGERL